MTQPPRIARALVLLLVASLCTACARQPFVDAHRGASADAPENTLPAFQLAWDQNADAIEGDFHLTRDGHIVCIHDANTQKTTGVDLVVKDATLAQLRQLDAGRWYGARWQDVSIPTLNDVLDTVPPGKKIYIEIKCGPEILPILFPQLRDASLQNDQIVLISFNADVVQQFKQHSPHHKAYWLKSFKPDQPPPSAPELLQTLGNIHADGLSSNAHISPDLVRALQDGGYEHHVWTVDDALTAQRFRALGTRSITTNTPGLIRAGFKP